MSAPDLHVVTGAFGYSGKYIATHLLAAGKRVRTLTGSPARANPFSGRVEARPFNFDQPGKLAESLQGAQVLYNTYWMRFNHRTFRQADAVDHTLRLFEAAVKARVRRVVHVSITNPAEDSPFEYFRGKARLERALMESGLSYAILRPGVLFGQEDILINNIAWGLRRFPFFGLFGNGQYRLQPIYVDDFARLAVQQGQESSDNLIQALGPEVFTYRGLVQCIGAIIGCPRRLLELPPRLAFGLTRLMGGWVGDVIITRDEIQALMAGLLYVEAPPAGLTCLTDWAKAHSATLGRRYASELARRNSDLSSR